MTAFGAVGRERGGGMKRPRLSYNVAVYHRDVRGRRRERAGPSGAGAIRPGSCSWPSR